MTAQPKPVYPRRATIERMIAAAKAAGEKVGGFEAAPDGTIRIMFDDGTTPARRRNPLDRVLEP